MVTAIRPPWGVVRTRSPCEKSGLFDLAERRVNVVGKTWVNHAGTMTCNRGEGKSAVTPAGRPISPAGSCQGWT